MPYRGTPSARQMLHGKELSKNAWHGAVAARDVPRCQTCCVLGLVFVHSHFLALLLPSPLSSTTSPISSRPHSSLPNDVNKKLSCREQNALSVINKCIENDTKAAARQSLNCIKNKKTNKIWRKTIFNMADGILTACNVARSWHWFRQVTAPCNVACGSGIMTVNSPSGSTLQCDTWLWDDMPLNTPGGNTLQCDT